METSRNVTAFQKKSVLDFILRLRGCMQTVTLDVEASVSIDNVKTQLALDSHEQGFGTYRVKHQ